MKPKEYVKKYKLDSPGTIVNREEFISDLMHDFMATIDMLKERKQLNYARFQCVISEFHEKLDSIRRRSTVSPEFFDGVRKYFYATVIVKLKEELFGDFLRGQARERERRSREDFEFGFGWNFWGNMFKNFWGDMMKSVLTPRVPAASATRMGLPLEFTKEDVNARYRELAKICHPDKGGREEDFKQLLEDKSKCLAYVQSMSMFDSHKLGVA